MQRGTAPEEVLAREVRCGSVVLPLRHVGIDRSPGSGRRPARAAGTEQRCDCESGGGLRAQ